MTLQSSREIATLWKPNQSGGHDIIDLGNLLPGEQAEANGINELGQIVGLSGDPPEDPWVAFVWQDGVMTGLPSLGNITDSANGINEMGTIVGMSRNAQGKTRAAIWRDEDRNGLYTIEDFGGGTAHAVNDFEEVTGDYGFPSGLHAFLRDANGAIIDMHNEALGYQSRAYAINNQSQAVGICYYGDNGPETALAFLWTKAEGMVDLNQFLPPLTGKEVNSAHDINEAGQIAADGGVHNVFDAESFLLSPVYPSMTLKAIGHGGALVAGANNALRVTGATPGARITFLWSSKGGGEAIPGCDLQENALQLDSPTIIGTTSANAQGVATLQRFVPAAAQGRTILLQAVAPSGCAISQLMLTTVQ